MARSRGYCFTINNWDDDDLTDLLLLTDIDWLTYLIIGFEVAATGTNHLQGYMHFTDAKSFNQIKRMFPKAHLEIPKAKGESYSRRWKYCMKEGDYWEYGVPPKDGGHKVNMSTVVQAINDGLSYQQLLDEYPTMCLMHKEKILRFIADRQKTPMTKFYVIDPVADAITEIIEHFDCDTNKMAVVTDLSQLQVYNDYNMVVYFSDYYDKIHSLWPRGVPITYKYGYDLRVVKVERMVIVTSLPGLYAPYYKRI